MRLRRGRVVQSGERGNGSVLEAFCDGRARWWHESCPFRLLVAEFWMKDGAAITGVRYDRQVWRVVLAPGRAGSRGALGSGLGGACRRPVTVACTQRRGSAEAAPAQSRLPGPVRS